MITKSSLFLLRLTVQATCPYVHELIDSVLLSGKCFFLIDFCVLDRLNKNR